MTEPGTAASATAGSRRPPPSPQAPALSAHERRAERFGLAAVLATVLAVYVPVLAFGFTPWDDPAFCVRNPDVAHPDLVRIFDPRNRVVGDWTPMATVTYAAERLLLGAEPWVPHATNVALHLVAVGLVQRLLRDVGFGVWTSLGAALVFGVHPLQVESVAWVSSRKGLLVAVFALAFLRAALAGRNAGATAWFLLALCSKATSVGLPLAAAAGWWLLPRRGAAAGRADAVGSPGPAPPASGPRPRAAAAWLVLWLVLGAARAALSLDSQAEATARTGAHGLAGRMATMGAVLPTQMRQVLLGDGLSAVYDPPRRDWDDPLLLGGWAIVAAGGVACAVLARRDARVHGTRRLLWVGVFGLATLAPTLNVVPGPTWQADRYAHLPLVAAAAFVLAALGPLARVHAVLPGAVLLGWTGAVLVPATLERQAVWRDGVALFEDAAAKSPGSRVAWNQLGVARAERKDLPGAIAAFRRAAEADPGEPAAALNLASALYAHDDLAEAERVVRALIARSPENGEAHGLLGCLHARAGRLDDAGAAFGRALRLTPDSALVRRWLDDFTRQTRPRR